MRRNAMNVTIKELIQMAEDLINYVGMNGVKVDTKFSIPIIAPNDSEIKDAWRFEHKRLGQDPLKKHGVDV